MTFTKDFAGKQGSRPLLFFLILMAFYSVPRLLFYIWNADHFTGLGWGDVAKCFFYGIRFDAAVLGPWVVLISLLILLGASAPPKHDRVRPFVVTASAILVIILCLPFLWFYLLNFSDIVLVNFMGRRFTKASLYLVGEGRTSNLVQYKMLSALCFLFVGLFAYAHVQFYKKFRQVALSMPAKFKAVFVIFALPMAVVIGRGGFQYKPISYVDAKVVDAPFAHHLVLNSTFTFLKSFKQNQFKKEKHFDQNTMLGYLNLSPNLFRKSNSPQMQAPVVFKKHPHIVIIMMESFSREYISPEQTPYFYQLTQTGAYFSESYANGRRSVEGIAAVLSGIPALMEEPFLNSEFASNEFVGLGQMLKHQNYQTSFFHGAENGSMRFDAFTRASGFDRYFGKSEYLKNNPQGQKDDDGAWGIYDGPFLQYTCDQFTQLVQQASADGRGDTPQLSAIFTLSSHQPFNVPDEFIRRDQIKFSNQSLEPSIQRSIRYADESIGQFMKCASQKSWFADTLFVFVADHTGPALNEATSTFKNKFEIPILFWMKDSDVVQSLNTQQVAQQIDILPTVLEMLGVSQINKNHLARSLTLPGLKTVALYSDQHFELVGDGPKDEDHLKAIRQYFSEGMYDNRLYFPLNFPAGSSNK